MPNFDGGCASALALRTRPCSFVATRVRFARHPHPSPFAPSPPVGALASRSVGYPRVLDRPRFVIAMSALLAGGFRNLPPLVRPGLAHRSAAAFFNTPAAVVARHDRLFSWSSPWGLCCFSASPPCPRLRPGAVVVAVGLVGLLRPVCCRARRGARGCSRSRFARHSGCRFAPLFFRLPLCVARIPHDCFPSLAASRGLPIIRDARPLAGFTHLAGAHAARTPL